MNIKFINARILKDPTKQEIIKGDLIVKGNRIFYVGETLNDDKEEYDRVIDCNGNLVMPGFKNAHAHTPMVFCRSLADDMPLHDWLFNKIFPLEDKLTSDDIYELTKLGIAENLTSGITSN
ncbi:MAG: amidohydrolase family protein, partial [Bacilli bacterium]|nr:amidohydrolase family protein [Bacilli bacterium]